MLRSLSPVVAIALLFAAAEGHAAPSAADEDALIRHGIELRKARDDLAARAEFQKAYDLTHSPRAAAQLGLAEYALGRWDDAEGHVSEALRTPGDPFVAKYRTELDRSLGIIKTHVARIEVIGEPGGAEIVVNGRVAGRLPLTNPVAVSEGQVDVELRASGYRGATRTVTVSGGQYQRLVMRLERVSTATAPQAAGASQSAHTDEGGNDGAGGVPAADSSVAADPTATGTTASPSTPGDRASGAAAGGPSDETGEPSTARRVVKWTSLGLAAAALGTGITATVIYNRNVSTFQRLHGGGCFDNGGHAVDAGGNPVGECQPSLDSFHAARPWQIGGFVAAGAFAATWLILTLTEPSASTTAATNHAALATWTCLPTVTGVGATCAARF